ncbi:hypothetical protein [Crocosphaera sp.]|uniref:hypothetical protein n=1 Tax=Crocosphaera sp. TaxID=2729996 RepID=UPI002601F232|nr:hypothetical protein [Crocosphaera sp.]MDJ0578567.1 hypothetical protein [Crocosphaera sp.]
MKKTLLVPHEYLKVLCQRWLTLVLSMVISISFLSLIYYLIKKVDNAQKETSLNIAYAMDKNLQLIYSQLLVNLVEEVAQYNWVKAINLAQK